MFAYSLILFPCYFDLKSIVIILLQLQFKNKKQTKTKTRNIYDLYDTRFKEINFFFNKTNM